MFNNDTDKLDQHFLIDENVKNKFLESMDLNSNDVVVEIGPGKGVLTKEIASFVKDLIVIEKDERLKPFLDKIENEFDNVNIIYDSVLDTYVPKCNKIVTSLPYSITEPFIEKLLRCEFDKVIMITGSNFANSVVKKEKNKLALLTNCFFDVKKIIDIPKECFNPMPKVMSSLVSLERKDDSFNDDIPMFIFKEIFIHRSKKIKNNLIDGFIKLKNITQKESKLIVEKLNIDDDILNKNIENLNNNEIDIIYEKLERLV